MRSRILVLGFAMIMMMGVRVIAQECATCTDAAPCNACASCSGTSCDLFPGLKNLMACRPCASVCEPVCAPAPVCAPCAPAPVCKPCVPAPVCAPCAPAPACTACDGAPACDACAPCAPCCGPLFPCLKPALCQVGNRAGCVVNGAGNAVCHVGNGARRMVSGLFGALADISAPKCVCACGIPTCGGCGADAGFGGCGVDAGFNGGCSTCGVAPAAPENAAPLPESPAVAE